MAVEPAVGTREELTEQPTAGDAAPTAPTEEGALAEAAASAIAITVSRSGARMHCRLAHDCTRNVAGDGWHGVDMDLSPKYVLCLELWHHVASALVVAALGALPVAYPAVDATKLARGVRVRVGMLARHECPVVGERRARRPWRRV